MKYLLAVLIGLTIFLSSFAQAFAIVDPLATPNNKFGIHILFPSEVAKAATLVNSNGGDWGYVVIPIQSGDKDLKKWQDFMNDCRKNHLIPIVRLATEGDYFNTKVWRKPTDADVLDFANFLNSLAWPTENRYVIVYNEVNRDDEWGGDSNPSEYANLLSYAVTVFKSRSSDFFVISSGMDNAAANSATAINEYTYFQEMNQAVPGIFNQIDGMSSHSYPNPAFSQPPTTNTSMSIYSFAHEKALLETMTTKNLPVFITETGWTQETISPITVGTYYQTAYQTVWNDPSIVTVAPFLLQGSGGGFAQFSFLDGGGSPNVVFNAITSLPKTKGAPQVNQAVLAAQTSLLASANLPTERFQPESFLSEQTKQLGNDFKTVITWFLKLH